MLSSLLVLPSLLWLSTLVTTPITPTSTVIPSHLKAVYWVAQESRTRRIQFGAGKNSTIVRNAVVRGTRDIYLVGARQGQMITITITSLENNAVFDVVAPPNQYGRRHTLKQAATSWSGVLPLSGDYQLVVGGTRGNASYQLQVKVR